MAQNSYQQLHMDLDGSFAPEKIIDLRAEYAEMAVEIGMIAQKHDCILSLSIDPDTPRFFLGKPHPLREILFTLVETSLFDADVDIVNVRLGSVSCGLQGRHRLEIMVASNGTALPPRQLTLFKPAPLPPPLNNCYAALQNRNRISRINKLLRPLNGNLRIDDVYGRGPRYTARFHLTKVMAANSA